MYRAGIAGATVPVITKAPEATITAVPGQAVTRTGAAEGTGPLSRAIGVYKEVDDARGGSGFSFNDMAANLAGTRFGEMAMRAPVELQALVAAGVTDDDLMPAWDDLPQFMPEAEFLHRYGGVGAPPYQAMMAEIDRRVGALRLFR